MNQSVSLDEVKKRILVKLSLEDLIGETTALQRRGSRLTGLCPFHAEKSPSFYVFDDHYHCFGCHEHGDAISFVRKIRDLGFIEALRFLAQKAGIDAPELNANTKYQQSRLEVTILSEIMVKTHELFVKELWSDRGLESRNYLVERGFTEDSIKRFGFGLTPAGRDGLLRHLKAAKYRIEDMVRAGVVGISTQTGQPYDFFRDRILIPIRDHTGKLIAFGGRTTVQDPAKYKNSSQTVMFDKGGVLFGLDAAREAAKSKGLLMITEGYMDTLCMWQYGFHNTVASMGTALSERHFKLILSQTKCKDVVILFDGDRAGQQATLESIELSMNVPELRVRAVLLPEGFDPDTYLRKFSSESMAGLIASAKDILEVVLDALFSSSSQSQIMGVMNSKIIPWLSKVKDPLRLGYFSSKLSGKTGVSSDAIRRQIFAWQNSQNQQGKLKSSFSQGLSEEPVEIAAEQIPLEHARNLSNLELCLLSHLYFSSPKEIDLDEINQFLRREWALHPLWEQFVHVCCELLSTDKSPVLERSSIVESFTASEVEVLRIVIDGNLERFETAQRQDSMRRLFREHEKKMLTNSMSQLKVELKILGRQDTESVNRILSEIMVISAKIKNIDQNFVASKIN